MSNSAVIEKQKLSASFPVRRMDYEFQNTSKYWCKDDPVFTYFYTGMSLLFPEGEAYFVRSVRALRNKIKTHPNLDRDIGAFIGQEAMHSKEHKAFHIGAEKYGLNPASLEARTGELLEVLEKIFPKKWNLAMTLGLEHFTAVLVVEMMKNLNETFSDDAIRNLWLWHSVEETEHKAVAYDMYEYLYGNDLSAYMPRVVTFTLGVFLAMYLIHTNQFALLKRDRQLFRPKSLFAFAKYMVKHTALFAPKFADFYRWDFHPNDVDESILVALTKEKIGILATNIF